MKNFLTVFTFCLLVYSGTFAQVTIKLGSVNNAEPGTDVYIPLIVSGLSVSGQSFIGVEIQFSFQDNIIAFDSLANGNPATPLAQWFAGSITGKVSANWLEPSIIPVNVDDNSILVEFVFDYTGGQTDLIIDQQATMVYDASGNSITIAQYTDGSIIQAQGSGSSIWNGTASWATPPNWSNGIPGDSTDAVINTGTVDLTSGGVCRKLTINSGAKLVIYPGNSLTVNSDFINNGEILIKSDSLIQGSLIVHGIINQTGSSEMEMKVFDGISYLFASPAEEATVSMISGTGSISRFSENTNGWTLMSGNEALAPYAGYALSASGSSVALFEGKFLSEGNTVNLQYTSQGNVANEGWNLVGNSFTSSFDADNYLTRTGTDRAIYTWDGMRYRVWNGTAGSIPGGIIPPLTAFFVRANSTNASVTFNNSGKIHDFSHFGGNYSTPQNVLPVEISNFDDASALDEAFVQVDQVSTFNYEGDRDALKLGNAAAYPEIYLMSGDNHRLSIAVIPEATELIAGVKVPVDGTYVISAQTNNFLPGRPVYLIDQELEITRDLRTEDYVFIISAGDHPERFKFVFTGLGTEDLAGEQGLQVYISQGNIMIHSLKEIGNSTVKVYDLMGRLHAQSIEMLEPGTVTSIKAITGINIVRVETEDRSFNFKIIDIK